MFARDVLPTLKELSREQLVALLYEKEWAWIVMQTDPAEIWVAVDIGLMSTTRPNIGLTNFIELVEAALDDVGNWESWPYFSWEDRPFDAAMWTIKYTSNRDSNLLEQSNDDAMTMRLQPYLEGLGSPDIGEDVFDPDIRRESHRSSLVGHVDGFSIRIFQAGGTITQAYTAWHRLQLELARYPVLDEDDYSQRQHEATLNNIEQVGIGDREWRVGGPPENWVGQVFGWLWENNPDALEDHDGNGGYPAREAVIEAADALNLLESEDPDA